MDCSQPSEGCMFRSVIKTVDAARAACSILFIFSFIYKSYNNQKTPGDPAFMLIF
jgi:hypothetical protein